MRWRVLVADDEPVILSGIKKFIEDSELNCEVVAEANNGVEAINLIEEHKPHIVVSDIQMPGATGLEIIKRFYEKDDCPKFIFVSGYGEFKYVQEAIRYEAVDYLLKPVAFNEIKERLAKCIKQLNNQSTLSILKEEKNSVESFFEEIYKGNEFTEIEMYEKFKSVGINYDKSFFVGVCFSVDFEITNNDTIPYEKQELKKFVIYDYIYNYYKERKCGFVTKKDDMGCHLILVINNKYKRNYEEDYILPLKNKIDEQYSVKVYVGLGEPVDKVCKINHTFNTAKISRKLYYFEEKEVIKYKSFENSKTFEDYYDEVNAVIESLILKKGQLLDSVEKIMNTIENLNYGNRHVVINRCSLFIEEVYMKMKDYQLCTEKTEKLKNTLLQEINDTKTYKELKAKVSIYFSEIEDFIAKDETIREKIEIARVKKYISENYSRDITLKMLANMIGMNSTYFSVFFKKNAGENYMSYLTKIRMKEAHRLLMSTDMLTYEIAESVGYNTVRRFTEAFKKSYGANPMEYKKSNL